MRGSLISNSTARSSGLMLPGRRMNGKRSSSALTVASGLRSAAPTRALTNIAATRKATAMP